MRISIVSDDDVIPFANGMYPDYTGFWIVAGGIDGLYGSPGIRETPVDIPQMDGQYWPSRLTQGGRTITLKCGALCRTSVETANVLERLSALMTKTLRLRVEDESGVKTLSGFIADDFEPSIWWSRDRVYFTIIFYCPDPLKYGPAVSFVSSGSVVRVENAGRVAVYPSVRVNGSVSAMLLMLGSRTVQWTGNANGLDLDLRDMIPSSGVVSGQAFKIPPGVSAVPVSWSGNGSLILTVSPAWR
ncbi:hypothetical protein [Bifidobacterium sp.]|jgi:phage-related protein|uniref:hypothetical protein n=1 Tax=Bifidobacterium sp. TaxID=41200 RepID=UPI0025BF4AF6|nr:hypothetical protein [Bifidobacterium sp.]MCI1635211.1 hypothetical protein [Bifidobacterium sp.]